MKRLLAITLVLMFTMIPMVASQGEQHNFSYPNMTPHESVIEYVSGVQVGDEFYLNLTVQPGMRAYVNIYSSPEPLASSEVYGNNNVYDNFTLNITTEVGGTYSIYLFNDNDQFISISGWWVLNLNITTITNITDATTIPTGTWTGTTPPTQYPDYLGIFLDVVVRFVVPTIFVIIVIFFLYRYCRIERFDYLSIFEDREMVETPNRIIKEE